jgi:PAS domain S-box-containing protein
VKKSARVLNVDDNSASRYIKSHALKLAGFDVVEAGTGAEALRLAHELPPDLALLDVKLPDISGLEVCRRLKQDPATSHIPVIQISATHVTEKDEAAGLEHGADIYLTEPTEPIVLLTVVRTLLRLYQSESGLRASEERFKAVVNQATAGIGQTDLSGRFVLVNQRYCDIVGRSAEELSRLGMLDITHRDDAPRLKVLLQQMTQGGGSFDLEKRDYRPDGSWVWTSNAVSLVRDSIGRPQGAIAVVIDITQRKRAEEAAQFLVEVTERLAALTDQASTLQKVAAVVVPALADWCVFDLLEANGTHRRVASSHAAPTQLGISRSLNEGLSTPAGDLHGVAKVMRTRQPELIEEVSQVMLESLANDEEHLRFLREFQLKSYLCVPLLGRDRLLGTLTLGTATSGRRYMRSDLAVAQDLAHRIAVAMENASLYQALKEAAKRKDEFLAILAHELRNPLAPLRNAVEILGKSGSTTPNLPQITSMMARQLAQLVRLVDDLLDTSRISQGKIELRRERLSLQAVINQVLEAMQSTIEAKHELSISLPDEDLALYADPARIAQVVINLLDNAVKYTPAGGRVTLSAQRSGRELVITVTDNGIGIDAAMLPHIFEMFAQADQSLEKSRGGLGIGLTLAKQLAEMHGGRIEARSPGLGRGSTFSVCLPLTDINDPIASANAKPVAADGARRRIVVVDDNTDSATSLRTLLELMGHEVMTANDGAHGLRVADDFRPHIVFLDIGLPGMSGYEVARRLRLGAEHANTYLVALSGYGASQDRKRSQEAGFDMHIAKPADVVDLQRVVENSARH